MTAPREPQEEGQDTGLVHLPSPSVWPFVLGGGLSLALFGVATSWLFTAVGAVLALWALVGWIEDLRHE
jgi:Cytochrome c oxidase subunit IV